MWIDILTFIGGGVVFFAVICIFIWACVLLNDLRHAKGRNSFADGQACERAKIAQDADWFSEDNATRMLLKNLAYGQDVHAVREKWRKQRNNIDAAKQLAEKILDVIETTHDRSNPLLNLESELRNQVRLLCQLNLTKPGQEMLDEVTLGK